MAWLYDFHQDPAAADDFGVDRDCDSPGCDNPPERGRRWCLECDAEHAWLDELAAEDMWLEDRMLYDGLSAPDPAGLPF